VEYTIIPALTLISSSLMLLCNTIGRLHHLMINCKIVDHEKMQQNTNISNNDTNNSGSLEEQKNVENNSYSRIRRITI
jgi:hypothetical protein